MVIGQLGTTTYESLVSDIQYYIYEPVSLGMTDKMLIDGCNINIDTISRSLNKLYNNIMKKEGRIHLKTDNQFLHGFTLGVIEGEYHILEDGTHDLYNSAEKRDHMEIKTHYDQIYLDKGLPITYLRFRLNY